MRACSRIAAPPARAAGRATSGRSRPTPCPAATRRRPIAPSRGWLVRTIPATTGRLREVEAAGREIGHGLAPGAETTPEQAIVDVLASLGFRPEVEAGAPGHLSCRLRNCPYRDSVRDNQAVVCILHRGVMRGLLERIAPEARLTRFVPHDPDLAGCEVDIEGL